MIHRTLWRIDGPTNFSAVDHERFAAGIRLHVIHSPLTTITMQIGAQQRSYLVLEGCMGCPRDQCRLGCPTALFRRLFQSCVTGATLTAVAPPQGLVSRPYTRSIFAWPDTHAQSLDSAFAFLQPWGDARIMVHWRRYGAHICGSALLLASADGPDPTSALRECNWHVLALPSRMVTRWHQAATPSGLPFGVPWQQPLFLMVPTCPDSEPSLQIASSGANQSPDGAPVSQEGMRQ
jgi:hypothetical protein